jgi:hypothetical protein
MRLVRLSQGQSFSALKVYKGVHRPEQVTRSESHRARARAPLACLEHIFPSMARRMFPLSEPDSLARAHILKWLAKYCNDTGVIVLAFHHFRTSTDYD